VSGNDFALLEQWRSRRDPEAFRELVGRYAGMVHGACRRILGDASEAEDVAQECFLILACGARPPERHLGAWLHRVATNLSRNHVRAQARRREREQRFADATPRDAELQWEEVADLVDELIAALPDDLRVPLVAHFLEGQSKEAVARTLGVSRPAVSYRIDKGVGRIRARLRSRGILVGPAALASLLAANAAEAAPATDIRFCAIDDPTCEACQ
jgi:RNA polymerase sigma-70 factor (ECF subfamily)